MTIMQIIAKIKINAYCKDVFKVLGKVLKLDKSGNDNG